MEFAVYNVFPASWATRAKALFNIAMLNFIGFGLLVLQSIAALEEAILLSAGSIGLSLAFAAHAKGFEGYVTRRPPSKMSRSG